MKIRFKIILLLIFVLLIAPKVVRKSHKDFAFYILINPKGEHEPHNTDDFYKDNIDLDKFGVYYGKAIGAEFILPDKFGFTAG